MDKDKKNLIVGSDLDNLTDEQEIAILKLKNGTHNVIGNIGVIGPWTGGIASDLWNEGLQKLDVILIRNKLRTYFVNLFDWKINDVDKEFIIWMEQILFQYGAVAIFKAPDGKFYPANFTYDDNNLDFYQRPTKIKLLTNNKFNQTIVNKKNFVIIYNNTDRLGTLHLVAERIRQTVRSLWDVDNASLQSRPKWVINQDGNKDTALDELIEAYYSNKPFIDGGNINFADLNVENLAKENVVSEKIQDYQFKFSNLLKFLGLKVNDGNLKAERQTELEIARNDEYDNMLLLDMFEMRNKMVDELKELGLKVELTENEIITGENEQKDKVNGELNKHLDNEDLKKNEVDNE